MRKIYSMSSQTTQPVCTWLMCVSFMVIIMIMIGGITRLTDSGLSMVEWRPLMGFLPPLTEQEWMRIFNLYRQSPEYLQINAGMTLAEFQEIFFWEWFHRLWGRLIGIVFALPALWFLVRGYIPSHDRFRIIFLFILGGSQGVVGWWMVKSGLVNEPDVAPLRLMIHLLLALAILGMLIWVALSYREKSFHHIDNRATSIAPLLSCCIVFLIISSGAIVAGLKGGLIYNEFPLMGGHLLPEDYWASVSGHETFWQNALQSHAAAQFHHRILAILGSMSIFMLAIWHIRRTGSGLKQVFWAYCVCFMLIVQVCLGISVLVLQVPFNLAIAHQLSAVIIFSICVAWFFYARQNI